MQAFPRIPAKVSWYVFDRWHQFLFSSKCSLLKESLTVLNTETSILLCFWKCPFCLKIHLIDLFISCSGEVLGRLHILQSRHFTGIFFQGTVLTREILPLRRRQPLVLFSFVGPPQTEQLCHLGKQCGPKLWGSDRWVSAVSRLRAACSLALSALAWLILREGHRASPGLTQHPSSASPKSQAPVSVLCTTRSPLTAAPSPFAECHPAFGRRNARGSSSHLLSFSLAWWIVRLLCLSHYPVVKKKKKKQKY